MLLEPARARPAQRFAVAGLQYPETLRWPENVERLEHVLPAGHAGFYATQRYTLNLTPADMCRAGCSPSVRLFEAAACAAPIVTDVWSGLDRFFQPGREILLARTAEDVLYHLDHVSEEARRAIGARARERVLAAHTAEHRAAELERLFRVVALRSSVMAAVAAR
jgi:spore maturation protein CgeB